ncbi:MAG: aminopeptidase P family protein [Dehalococcoidales bacterium]
MQTEKRISKLREILKEKNLDAVLISQPQNRYYLSGFSGSAGYLLITQNNTVLATDFRYVEQVKEQSPLYTLFQITDGIDKWFPEITGGLNIKTLGFEPGDITIEKFQNFSSAIQKSGIELDMIPLPGAVEKIRAVKDAAEIVCIEQAVKIADKAFEHLESIICPGMTELDVAWELEKALREAGSETVPFEIIVGSGPNAALPHAYPTERRIKAKEPIVIDFGAKYKGYCSDCTRTLCLGGADNTFNEIYKIVLEAQLHAIANIAEGTTGAEADYFARSIIDKAGHGAAFGHSLGHGIGLVAHEKPALHRTSADILTENMVFTIEPGIYIPGWGGVRIEDTVVLKNGKMNVISGLSK